MIATIKQISIAGLLVCAATGAQAKPQIFDCTVNTSSVKSFFVTARYFFQHEPGAATAEVFDGLIKHEVGKPVSAKVTEDTPSRTTFSWALNVKDSANHVAKLIFHATYFKGNKSVIVAGAVGGGVYVGGDEARGSCALH